MKSFFTYFWSKNKNIYIEIAKQYKCSSRRVYNLAHGHKAVSDKDYNILNMLVEKGIISGFRIK